MFILALVQVSRSMIIDIGNKDRILKVVFSLPDLLHVLFRPIKHRRNMMVVLPFAKRFGMNNHLMIPVHQCLTIIPLNGPVRGHHVGRLIICNIALDLFAHPSNLRIIFL